MEYQGPVKLILGMVLFPVYYAFLIWLLSSVFSFGWTTVLMNMIFPFSGFLGLHYWEQLNKPPWAFQILFFVLPAA